LEQFHSISETGASEQAPGKNPPRSRIEPEVRSRKSKEKRDFSLENFFDFFDLAVKKSSILFVFQGFESKRRYPDIPFFS
jgi:hypothetical protein